MNPNDIFWLARYAHRELSPIIQAPFRLTVTLQFAGRYPGVDIWTYGPDSESTLRLPYELACTTQGQVDAFVQKVKTFALVPA